MAYGFLISIILFYAILNAGKTKLINTNLFFLDFLSHKSKLVVKLLSFQQKD